ncbi:MAG: tetratricopeptide repeat protein [Xanthomonadales bacterium]|nr:tetratricopeptide repeat protein [Xanthomonadales bacterium]
MALGEDAWQTALFREGRALTLQAAKRYDEADREFSAAIRILESSLGPDHPRTERARQMRASLQSERNARF